MVAEKVFEVVYLQTEDTSTLCRYQLGQSGITVTNTVNEDLVLFLKWECVQAWWQANGQLFVNEKLEKKSSEDAADGEEKKAETKMHKFKSDQLSELVDSMTKSLSSLLKAQQSAILDLERSSIDVGGSKEAEEDSSKLTFKLSEPVEGNLMKQRNKFPSKSTSLSVLLLLDWCTR